MKGVREVDLKSDWPTAAEALRRLETEVARARRDRVRALKLIHGYGSTGVGGAIRQAVRAWLDRQGKARRLKAVVPGEEWSIFDAPSRQLLEACPDLARDPDLENYNPGITFVLL